jgi:hypothetical protein
MSFIRVKEIGKKQGKKYKYAYLVSNKWRKRLKEGKKGSRQKVGKYLGKVLNFESVSEIDFFASTGKSFEEYINNTKKEIVEDLIQHELRSLGFQKNGHLLKNENLFFDSRKIRFYNKRGLEEKAVIEMNEGFLCNETIIKLINFKKDKFEEDERAIGVELAKAFLEAGLRVPKELFVIYFDKI